MIARIIFIFSYSLLIDIKVVSVPGPAINGKAIGIKLFTTNIKLIFS